MMLIDVFAGKTGIDLIPHQIAKPKISYNLTLHKS
jgi:hypothetical protein